MMNRPVVQAVFSLWLCFSCSQGANDMAVKHPEEALFVNIPASLSHVDFVNKVDDGDSFNILTYRNFYNGGGVAVGDINNDGLADIFFTSNLEKNKLYLNKGNFTFENISESAGVEGTKAWSTGVTMADVNGDGFLDIYVCNSGDIKGDDRENELFINNQDLTFTDRAKEYNLNNRGFSTHASFFDYDLDGDLDCYILNNSFVDPSKIELNKIVRNESDSLGGDKLYRNDGTTFTDITQQAGIYSSKIGFGLGVSVGDINKDNLPDIYVSNDFWERDYLYINQGNGTFKERLPELLSICSVSSMGADIGDLNNDGWPEIYTTDMLAADNYRLKAMTIFDPMYLGNMKEMANYHHQILQNCMHVNSGNLNFQEQANVTGTAATDWSWGALMFDFENDGDKDIYVSNGIARDIMYIDFTDFVSDNVNVKKIVTEKGRFDWRDFIPHIPSNPLVNYAFSNNGKLSFSNNAAALGFGDPSFSNGAAYGDLDNDGDLDLVVNNVNMPAFLYRNETNSKTANSFLKISFKGNAPNIFGVGASVNVYTEHTNQLFENFPSRGFQSSTTPDLTIGLGKASKADSVVVFWPNGKSQKFSDVKAGSTLLAKQSEAFGKRIASAPPTRHQPLLEDVSRDVLPAHARHKENRYYDFSVEPLLHRMMSTEGPRILKGDINNDRLDDVILLGAKGSPDRAFVQSGAGKFYYQRLPEVEADSLFESTCGVLVDLNNDAFQDLVIGSGGNEVPIKRERYQLRVYWNDGKGGFRRDRSTMLDRVIGNFSTVAVGDFDGDRSKDLFIGARAVPGNYGMMPRSYLLRNIKGVLTDYSSKESAQVGMVTDAAWSDYDGDSDLDLIVVGDWMPVTVLINDKGRFSKRKDLDGTHGWWNRLLVKDLDGDGDEDCIVGNWGLNSKMKATVEHPLTMFVGDFDANGKTEFVINWYAPDDSVSYPFAPKLEMLQQLPHLKKSNLKYETYAHMTYETLFSKDTRQRAIGYTAHTLESMVLWNDNGSLAPSPLPREAQLFPVFGICANDFNGDGITDILLGGNFYALKPQMGRCDSGKGLLLYGQPDRSFNAASVSESGVWISGEVRDLVQVNTKEGTHILVGRNNNAVAALKQTKSK